MNPVEIEMNFPAEHGGNVFGQFDAYMKKNPKNTACESDPER